MCCDAERNLVTRRQCPFGALFAYASCARLPRERSMARRQTPSAPPAAHGSLPQAPVHAVSNLIRPRREFGRCGCSHAMLLLKGQNGPAPLATASIAIARAAAMNGSGAKSGIDHMELSRCALAGRTKCVLSRRIPACATHPIPRESGAWKSPRPLPVRSGCSLQGHLLVLLAVIAQDQRAGRISDARKGSERRGPLRSTRSWFRGTP